MLNERALEQIFFSRYVQFSLSIHESTIFHAHISLRPLVCGSTLSPPQLLIFGLHLLMTLGYSCTSLIDFKFIIMLPQKIFMSIAMNLSFLHHHDEAPVTSH